jgi:pyrroloquinoline quinone biosynthesis protein D
VKSDHSIRRPVLARHARYRWDALRRQHQLVYAEGVLVLNESGAAIVELCDGRTTEDVMAALKDQFTEGDPAADVRGFLDRLAGKGLLRDAAES